MMTFTDVKKLIMDSMGEDRSLAELQRRFSTGDPAEEMTSGKLSVHDASAIYERRRGTARAAGVDAWGLDDLLNSLKQHSADKQLDIFHFATPDRTFSILVDPETHSIIGSVSVPRRYRDDTMSFDEGRIG